MKIYEISKSLTIEATGAKDFDDKYNEAIKLHPKAEVKWYDSKPYMARLLYTEIIKEAENLTDEMELKGNCATCRECPYFNPTLKDDGSIDRRTEKGTCKYAEYGLTKSTSNVCEAYWRAMARGVKKNEEV